MKNIIEKVIDVAAALTVIAMAGAAIEAVLLSMLYLYVGERIDMTPQLAVSFIVFDYAAAAVALIWTTIENKLLK